MDYALLGGAAFLIYRLWKSRNQARYQPAYGGAASHAGLGANPVWGQSNQTLGSDPQKPGYFNPSWSQGASLSIDRETAEDLFFRVQGAWTRRDLGLVRDILSPEAASYLESDIRALKEHGHINRLENISIRQFAVVDTWQDAGSTFQKVRFTANLLDYTTDESGRILEGSDSIPVKFDEYWIFQHRPELARWQLAGIEAI